MPESTLGVGFLGAGPVTQAIHLPTLARLGNLFEVTHVHDVRPEIAASVAERVGAARSTSADALLADPRVEVVVICSPHEFHAEQAIAACRAGKRAVLCEKPVAMSSEEATAMAVVSAETSVPIVVGAMHTFDPGWEAAAAHWGDLARTAQTIRSSIVLPPNPRFEDWATEVITRPDPPDDDFADPEVRAAMVHRGVVTLAIHDLPLVRAFLPDLSDLEVLVAAAQPPFGYQVRLTAAGRRVELHAAMTHTWKPEWVLEVFSADQALRLEFTPSYVQAGSAVATLSSRDGSTTFGPYDHNGYEGEWRRISEIVHGIRPPIDPQIMVDDLQFALTTAAAAAGLVRSGSPGGARA